MTKPKWTKEQTIMYKTLHIYLKIGKYEPHKNCG